MIAIPTPETKPLPYQRMDIIQEALELSKRITAFVQKAQATSADPKASDWLYVELAEVVAIGKHLIGRYYGSEGPDKPIYYNQKEGAVPSNKPYILIQTPEAKSAIGFLERIAAEMTSELEDYTTLPQNDVTRARMRLLTDIASLIAAIAGKAGKQMEIMGFSRI